MKKSITTILISLISCLSLFAAPNYEGGNGTIISEKTENYKKVIIRKCELDVKIGDLLTESNRTIFDNYTGGKEIGKLKDNDKIKVLESCVITNTDSPADKWGNVSGEVWYKINFAGKNGWINIEKKSVGQYSDPYYNNRYEILETIELDGKKWTVRRLDQKVSVYENLNIRNNPGTKNTKVVYTIRPKDTDPIQTNVDVIAITQEKETIDGKTDYWLKIKYKNYEGWIFGGYTSVERGGPRYYIPEAKVEFNLGWY